MSSLQDKRWMHMWLENGCLAKCIVALSSVLFPNESSESAGLLCVAVHCALHRDTSWRKQPRQRSSACSACRVLCPVLPPPAPRGKLCLHFSLPRHQHLCLPSRVCSRPKALWRPLDSLKGSLRRHIKDIHLEIHQKHLGDWRNGH